MSIRSVSTASGAGSPPISFDEHDSDYRAGACNIGPAEIARRRRFGHLAVGVSVALFGLLIVVGVPPLVRFTVAAPAAVAVACYMEATLKFCIGFGWLGVFNFGTRGTTQRVADGGARASDRWRALRLSRVCAAISIALGAIAVILPV